ncbi:MAG: rRNA cytosine-C5-methyltransferase [Jiangellaceae bacterium]|nr:rRNA cytosine-C5-methyltransferase [Jiangellaceae bacterium]
MPPGDPARSVAFEVLRAVTERDAYANLVLPGLLRERGLTGRDAALATELAYGSMRGLGTYDAILAGCVDRPLDVLDPPVRDVLRIGAHQLLGTRIPAHAAVASAVELARAHVGEGPARLVNAVLRRVSTRSFDEWLDEIAPADPVERLALKHSHPAWIAKSMLDALDGDLAQLEQLLIADNERPEVTLVARPGRAEVGELLQAGARPGRWSPFAAVLAAGDPGAIAAVREQRAGVQDEGSQLVTAAVVAAPVADRDERWLDMCAGPGGKAALLAGLGNERGAALLAVERQPHRAQLVANALREAPGRHMVVAADSTRVLAGAASDRVLLDAPCTGLGALRRRPELRWRRLPSDLPGLRALQHHLLAAGVDAVRAGGLVAYVTCSPHLAETSTVVHDLLRTRDDVEQVDARPFLPGVPDIGSGPDVQLWPHRHGTDAMYLALLRRR